MTTSSNWTSDTADFSQSFASQDPASKLQNLVEHLYHIKEKFELSYYGQAAFENYEKARNFTIRLNSTLFKTNRLLMTTDTSQNLDPSTRVYVKSHLQGSNDDPTFRDISQSILKLEQELLEFSK